MTERLIWTPDDPKKEPVAHLNLPNGETFEARRDTATLWTFMGRLAIFNHVFCCETEDQEVKQAFYIFNGSETYNKLAGYMVDNSYPMILNQTEVSSTDQEAYLRSASKDIDTTPDWL